MAKSNHLKMQESFPDGGLLLQRALRNDRLYLFGYIMIRTHLQAVFTFCLRNLQARHLETEALQDVIKAWKKYQNSIENGGVGLEEGDANNYNFNLALGIIQDFVENGLYLEFENIKTIRKSGKIEFSDTIKKCKPLVTAKGAVYLEYYTKVKKTKDQNILRAAQARVLNEISSQIGWAIGFSVKLDVPDNTLKLDNTLVNQLHRLRSESFNTRKIHLINQLINYINMKAHMENTANDYAVATAYHFWETIVSDVIGNIGKKDLNRIFYVRHEYHKNPTKMFLIGISR